MISFNRLFLQELCALTKKDAAGGLEYLGKSRDNRSKFYNYSVLSLEPNIWAKPFVYEALGKAISKWVVQKEHTLSADFDWGV